MGKLIAGLLWLASAGGALAAGALAGCSIDRVTFTLLSDAAQDGSVEPSDDAPPDTPAAIRCDPAKPFGPPLPIIELNTTAAESHATLTADELTVYFTSTRPGGPGNMDIYRARRPVRDAPWEPPELVEGINTSGHESRPAIRDDGLTLYAETNAISPNAWSISAATRPDPAVSFGPLVRDEILNLPTAGAVAPSLLPDSTWIYFARSGDLYRATWTGVRWGAVTLVEGVNSPESEDYPLISPDHRTLYFSSRRPGGAGDHDVWIAKRASATEAFGAPVPFLEINTAAGDFPAWVSNDDCELWFTRLTGAGDFDLVRLRRPL